MSSDQIRVLIADDQALFRGALATVLSLEADITVVAEVGDGAEVLDAARDARPDVAVVDIQMPGADGFAVTAMLREELPSCRVLVCTTFARPGYLSRAMAAGAAGFVVKDSPPEALIDAVRRVHLGLHVVDPTVAQESAVLGPNPLSAREIEVLCASQEHGTVADTAAAIHLSEGTIRNYLSAAIGKTGTRTRTEAYRVADERGWLH